ncbi:hypothetical protein [Sciscionella marina]|uniref:hypothetical protein n=1 Tax=Sciscionella marina TaxID=508770 RepID=UPI00037C23EB|nr:hypothetical protein [Sciscionella marina]
MTAVEHEREHATRAGPRRWLGPALDLFVVALAVVLVVIAALGGWQLRARGVDIFLGWPPLLAGWAPHWGSGTVPAVLLAAVLVIRGPELAVRLRWPVLLTAAYLISVAWTTALALVDGWDVGIAGRLTSDKEYYHDVGRVHDIVAMLGQFSQHVLTDTPAPWSMHVGAHPPGAFLLYVSMHLLGLGGGGAGMVTILIGASAAVAVAVTLRALASEDLARRVLPFAVLFPGAVWVGVSADGMFAGILAWGVALVALGCAASSWPRRFVAFGGGVLLGYSLYLSYGLATAALLPIAVFAVTRRWLGAAFAVLGVVAVVGAFTALGFWWFTGFDLVRIVYADSVAKTRPYSYFVWSNIAALLFALGPAVVVGVRRMVANPKRLPLIAVLLAAAAAIAVAASDYSGMSKAEVERIWLPFAVWLLIPCAAIPRGQARYWLAAQGVLALLVNHLLFTIW